MRDVIYLLLHLLTTLAQLIRPGGNRAVIAENLLLKQQLIIHSRSRQRAPYLTTQDRAFPGFSSLYSETSSLGQVSHNHQAIYPALFSQRTEEMKLRNPRFGCPRIAQQINLTFGLDLDKDIIRRVLAIHYKPDPSRRGPLWLTIISHAKDSLWSVDLLRRESIGLAFRLLRTHWVMVVMDQYTRRIIGFGVHAGNVDGPAVW